MTSQIPAQQLVCAKDFALTLAEDGAFDSAFDFVGFAVVHAAVQVAKHSVRDCEWNVANVGLDVTLDLPFD